MTDSNTSRWTNQTNHNKMNDTCDDYLFLDIPTIMASIYISLCLISLLLNVNVIALLFRSRRMLDSPKYWLVIATCIVFMLQSAVSNNILAAKWLAGELTYDVLWKICVIFNRYIAIGIVSWGMFLVNLDFLVCMKSPSYTRYYRNKIILLLMGATWAPLVAVVTCISVLRSVNNPGTSWILDKFNHEILLWTTFFAPMALSMICIVVVVIWRCNAKLQSAIVTNEDVSDPVDMSACPFLPPADHLAFVLALVLFYVPSAVLAYSPIEPDECPPVHSFWIACTVIRDNAGSVAPFAWFLFKDMRLGCRRCCVKKYGSILDDLMDSSEMNIYDSYPYCTRIQV